MTPDQVPAPCPFCDILAGNAPGELVAQWPEAVALVPLNPVTPGHVLIVPRVHVPDFTTNPNVSAATMAAAAEYATSATTDLNLITSRGPAATQTVHHLHLHLVPRHHGDALPLPWDPRTVHHGDIGGLSRVEITSSLGMPPYVRIERGGVALAVGYVTADPRGLAPVRDLHPTPPGLRDDTPLEHRLNHLAADMQRDAPMTANILRQFAAEIPYLRHAGAVYTPEQLDERWAADIRRHAARERRVHSLAMQVHELLADDEPATADVVDILRRLGEAIDPTTEHPID